MIKVATLWNKKKKTGFHTKLDQFLCMVKFAKVHPGTLPHLRWSSLQQLVTAESCKGLHLMGFQPITFWNSQIVYSKKKLFTQYLNITWLSALFSKFPVNIYNFKVNIRNSRIRSKTCSKLKRKTPERHQLTVRSCQLMLFWCLSLLILDIFHTVF